MTENDNDINRDPEIVAKQLTARARQHFIRISTNVTDGKIPRPRNYKQQNFTGGDETNI